MVAAAIGFFLAYFLVRMEAGEASRFSCICFGVLLGLEYLTRAAFAPLVVICICISAVLLRQRRISLLRPITYVGASALAIALPFVLAVSISKGHFTIG